VIQRRSSPCLPCRIGLLGFGLVLASCEASTIQLAPEAADAGVDATLMPDSEPCLESSVCAGGRPHCETLSGKCVECLSDAHCSDGQACNEPVGDCVRACAADPDCSDRAELCDALRGLCVECYDDSHCTSGFCSTASGECVECLSDADCAAEEPYCDLRHQVCEECLQDGHCRSDEICDPESDRCADAD
jgi:Cys-rich repeat protein